MRTLQSILIGEIILLLSWMIIEGIYTSSLIGCLIAMLALLILTFLLPSHTNNINHKAKMLLVVLGVLVTSFFVMEISHLMSESESAARLPLHYNKLKYIGYFSLYASVICVFFGAVALLVSVLIKIKK